MRVCTPLPLSCDYCFTLELPFATTLNVLADLTPASTIYVWVTDKFGNQYSDETVANGDGSFDIDTANYPSGLFSPLSGWYDIFITSDVDGQTIVPMTFVSEFNCLKLSTYCIVDPFPLMLPGLFCWYRSDLGVIEDVGVSIWEDQSGGGNDLIQATGIKQPELIANQLNGHDALSFDGVNDLMITPLIVSLNQPNTIFIVFKLRNYIVDKTIFDATNTFGSTVRTHTASPNLGQFAGSYIDNNNFVANQYCLMTSIFDGANSILQINNNVETIGNCGVGNLQGLCLGARPDGSDHSQIDVCEVIMADIASSVTDRNAVKLYILERYGIS